MFAEKNKLIYYTQSFRKSNTDRRKGKRTPNEQNGDDMVQEGRRRREGEMDDNKQTNINR